MTYPTKRSQSPICQNRRVMLSGMTLRAVRNDAACCNFTEIGEQLHWNWRAISLKLVSKVSEIPTRGAVLAIAKWYMKKRETWWIVGRKTMDCGTGSNGSRGGKRFFASFAYTQTIVLLYANDCSPIRKRPCGGTRFQMHYFIAILLTSPLPSCILHYPLKSATESLRFVWLFGGLEEKL